MARRVERCSAEPADLSEAGIGEGVSEVIVTTRSASGKPNAAPVGVISESNRYFARLYEGSRTLSNVRETSKLAANVTSDAVLFVKSALGNLDEAEFSLFFSSSDSDYGFPVLSEASSWIIFETVFTESSLFQLTPVAVKISRKEVKAVNRGFNAVVEATILATRFGRAKDEGEKEETKKKMRFFAEIVEKCGGRREKEALSVLREKIKNYPSRL
ncbi:MAG: DUF447 domain-containing protein [Candidatus Methanophagaceae archaeon]|nr:MAG: DUF447 domain-containing protein [Methanophagales archaeon]